ncbi:hypothetical protein [Leptothermofonsia sp. ETS-13]|uniref:hypothetical protein n=1 Tax=Leptothermofonsia sp. ETS-13 TaxID=3035696 RepID=UPI003BA37DE5
MDEDKRAQLRQVLHAIALRRCVRTLELEREWGLRLQPGVPPPAPRPNHNDYRYNLWQDGKVRSTWTLDLLAEVVH